MVFQRTPSRSTRELQKTFYNERETNALESPASQDVMIGGSTDHEGLLLAYCSITVFRASW